MSTCMDNDEDDDDDGDDNGDGDDDDRWWQMMKSRMMMMMIIIMMMMIMVIMMMVNTIIMIIVSVTCNVSWYFTPPNWVNKWIVCCKFSITFSVQYCYVWVICHHGSVIFDVDFICNILSTAIILPFAPLCGRQEFSQTIFWQLGNIHDDMCGSL